MQSAGFSDIEIVEGPDHAEFPVEDDLHALARRILVQNPLTNPRFASADEATRAAALDTVVPAQHQRDCVLAGGDDYELVFTAAPNRRADVLAAAQSSDTPVTRIGQIDAERALFVLDEAGAPITGPWASFDHFN